ncbi:MAG: outer membrane lipid asymmetry maintenance protein MlaD [Nitrospirae bacterium]|nr:outer membrane lipid asymmetry maintenance protein MlaD [Nitrospirota bacterium]MCL5236401.1 outer membrane lipid asymmetry maintenance protein MlaD [Nitrospirota bacterium]
MKKFDVELAAGFFLLIGILALAFISIKLGKLEVLGGGGYALYAEFEKAGGVKVGSSVEIAGVEIGKVKSIRLDSNYQALVGFVINKGINIQDDAIASIKTKGLIGEKYVQITPGGSDKILSNGGKIRETESSIDIEDLISKYVYGKV